MSKLVDTLRAARIELEQISSLTAKVAESLSPEPGGGGGGGGTAPGGGPSTPIVINYNESFNVNPTIGQNVTTNSPPGPRGDGDLQRAFAFFQMSYIDKSEAYQKQIVALFLSLTKKVEGLPGGVGFRMKGGG